MSTNSQLLDIKIRIARAQLATAMELFIQDKDPISVQVLSCGACEVLEKVVMLNGGEPISTHILKEQTNLNLSKLRKGRSLFWNAFKHVTCQDETLRSDDVDIINGFSDRDNDTVLFLAWFDYQQAVGRLPVSAQVFQAWFYALNPRLLNPHSAHTEHIIHLFPKLDEYSRQEQKRQLRSTVGEFLGDEDILRDQRTEPE